MIKDEKRNIFTAVLMLIITLFAVVGTAFAFWAGTFQGAKVDSTESITIGEAGEVITSVTLDLTKQTGTLVPAGRVQQPGQVEEIKLTYSVKWENSGANVDESDNIQSTLTVTPTVTWDANPSEEVKELLNVAFVDTHNIVLNGDAITVIITITLTEPSTKAIYDALQVASKSSINIKVDFEVTPVPNV